MQTLGPFEEFGLIGGGDLANIAKDRTEVTDRFDHVAGAGLALRADHACAFGNTTECFAKIGCATNERNIECPLVDVVGFVSRCENFGLVDVVDLQRLKDLSLGDVTDAGLGHDRDADDFLNALNHFRVAHSSNATVTTDVGGHSLEGHNRNGSGVFSDLGLRRIDNVHDDAALEHVSESTLDEVSTGCSGDNPVGVISHGMSLRARTPPERSRRGSTLDSKKRVGSGLVERYNR